MNPFFWVLLSIEGFPPERGASRPDAHGKKPARARAPAGRARAARRGHRGMPSRISPRPATTSGRRPSMAGSGHPPAAAAGSDLSSRREEGQGRRASGRRGGDSRADILVGTAERTSVAAAGDDRANRRRLSYRTDECRSPSRAPGGVLPAGHGWPAAGRGSWTRTPAGGAHPPVRATGSANPNEVPPGAQGHPAARPRSDRPSMSGSK